MNQTTRPMNAVKIAAVVYMSQTEIQPVPMNDAAALVFNIEYLSFEGFCLFLVNKGISGTIFPGTLLEHLSGHILAG